MKRSLLGDSDNFLVIVFNNILKLSVYVDIQRNEVLFFLNYIKFPCEVMNWDMCIYYMNLNYIYTQNLQIRIK